MPALAVAVSGGDVETLATPRVTFTEGHAAKVSARPSGKAFPVAADVLANLITGQQVGTFTNVGARVTAQAPIRKASVSRSPGRLNGFDGVTIATFERHGFIVTGCAGFSGVTEYRFHGGIVAVIQATGKQYSGARGVMYGYAVIAFRGQGLRVEIQIASDPCQERSSPDGLPPLSYSSISAISSCNASSLLS